MKIGDKVRFLNEVGGGVISGFPDKDTVLVCDEDGFEIPTLRKEVVVIDTNDYNIAKVHTSAPAKNGKPAASAPTSVKKALQGDNTEEEEEEKDLADAEITFRPMAQERRGANELNLMLAFVPTDIKHIAQSAFEAYLVNDCNYFVHYAVLATDGKVCHLRYDGELAPNTKILLDELHLDNVESWENLALLATSYKREKDFVLKPAMNVNVRIDFTKFYRLHAFTLCDFFTTPALLVDVIRNDHPVRSLHIDADELQDALQNAGLKTTSTKDERPSGAERRAKEKDERNGIIEVDLHADQLLDDLSGLTPRDILDYQIETVHKTIKAHLKERGRRIVFIHGKGDGVLRKIVTSEIRRGYKQCDIQDASFQEYGYGATMVTIG